MSFYKKTWWKEATAYQIYIKSFKDSNSDGIGDINGITEKLDYLKNLGIDLLWICPFYKSPMDDNGYDVSDYLKVDESFGSIEDFKNLIKEASKRKMKVIVELILNQTSDEHFWFTESRKSKDNPYRDYYIWQKGKKVDGKLVEPTNWASFFGGSAWEYDDVTSEYYMKIFSKKMPDLNWKNKNLRKDMQEVAKFWLDLGVSGFRVDAVAHLAKDDTFTDSIMKNKSKYKPDWRKFSNLEETFLYLDEFNNTVFSPHNALTVGEVGGGATVKEAIRYSSSNNGPLSMVFNFDHCWANNVWDIKDKNEAVKVDLLRLKDTFNNWQTGLYKKAWNPLYWLNHDQPRLLSQYGNTNKPFLSGSMLAISLYFMWGTPFVYQGEELGMTNYPFKSIDDFNDVSIKNHYQQEVVNNKKDEADFIFTEGLKSRDNARTIMSWNDGKYAGFSDVLPWFHLDVNYKTRNAEAAKANKNSLYNFYKKIFKLRKTKKYLNTLIYGSYTQILKEDEFIYAYLRESDKLILVVTNFFNKEVNAKIDGFKVKKVLLSNYNTKNTNLNNLKLKPYEANVYVVERIK